MNKWRSRLAGIGGIFACALTAHAVTITANFDALIGAQGEITSYQESGINFENTKGVMGAASTFKWFWCFEPSAIYGGQIAISANDPMTSVSLFVGNDWSDYLIAYGQLHPFFKWEAWRDGQVIDQGNFGGAGKGYSYTVSNLEGFDRVLVSTWSPEFGQGLLALGNVLVETMDPKPSGRPSCSVPETANPLLLLLVSSAGLVALRRVKLTAA